MYRLPDANSRWVLEDVESDRLKAEHPALWADPQISCLTCSFERTKTKTFRWWNPQRTEIVTWECNCTAQWIIYRYLLKNGVGKHYQRLDWADGKAVSPSARKAVDTYLDNSWAYVDRGVNLILNSPDPGTGKSLLLYLMAKRLLVQGLDVFVIQMNDLIEKYTSGWQSEKAKEYFERRIMNCTVLGIDDLGKESMGENTIAFVERLLDRVLRHRIASAMPILISTNWDLEVLTQRYGAYVGSLLTESSIFADASGLSWREEAKSRLLEEAANGYCRPLVAS